MSPQCASITARVNADLATRGRIGAVFYVVTMVAITVWTGLFRTDTLLAAAMVGLAVVIAAWRLHLVRIVHHDGTDPTAWRTRFRVAVVLAGLNWSLFGAWIATLGITSAPFLMVVIGCAGLSLGGTVVVAPDLRLVRMFLPAILLPVFAACAGSVGGSLGGLVVLLVSFVVFCFSMARSLNREYWTLLRTNLELEERTGELIAARDEAQAATRVKSDFLATMSHELRTPMNGVIGMADLLLDRDLESEAREYAQVIRASGEQLLMVINDILDFSKIEAGRLELEESPFDVRSAIQQTLDIMAQQAHAKGLELTFLPRPGTPRTLVGDQVRLQQIVLNLLSNAIKFTSTGHVTAKIAWRGSPSGGRLFVGVSDTGIGMTRQEQDRIFDPFSQADSSTTRRFGGTGLGLSIVDSLVQAMCGHISVRSERNKGSRFVAVLPLPAADGERRADVRAHGLDRKRVATVVRDEKTHESLRIALGLQMVAAMPADQWDPAAWRAARPDLIVVDDREAPGLRPELLPDVPVILLQRWSGTTAALPSYPCFTLRKPFNAATLAKVALTALGDASRSDASPALTPSSTPAVAPPARGMALVAEDNPFSQKVALLHLSALGFVVDVVDNGQDAVDAVRDGDYAVVFMDCRMPIMDGFEATRRIRELPDDRGDLPIIALTANATSDDAARCLAAGMDRFLAKPVQKEELAAVVAEVESGALHPEPIG